MAKLNTTVNNLELKENKIINGTPDSSWTDEQYPSARTLYNVYSELTNGQGDSQLPDDAESTSNKIKNETTPNATWTEDQYPSAKTLYNIYDSLSSSQANKEDKTNKIKSTDANKTPSGQWTDDKYLSAKVAYLTYQDVQNDIGDLNTTLSGRLDGKESLENKITGAEVMTSSWSDDEYLSAASFYNIVSSIYEDLLDSISELRNNGSSGSGSSTALPVGSIVCMATNTNPASSLGGTWELVDKEFKYKVEVLSADTNFIQKVGYGDSYELFSATQWLQGHTVLTEIRLQPTADSGSIVVGLDYNNFLGISLPSTSSGDLSNAVHIPGYQSTLSLVGTVPLVYTITDNMTGTLISVVGDIKLKDTFGLIDQLSLTYDQMPDALCDKFYFKRTT